MYSASGKTFLFSHSLSLSNNCLSIVSLNGFIISIFFKDFGYEYLTLEEILLAFRLNVMPTAEKVQFTGTCVNVDFISKVINEYLNTRKLLDRKLQNFQERSPTTQWHSYCRILRSMVSFPWHNDHLSTFILC